MPQLQEIEGIKDPLAAAMSNFGKGYSQGAVQGFEQQRQDKMLEDLLASYTPKSPEEADAVKMLTTRGVPAQTKASVYELMNHAKETAHKRELELYNRNAERKNAVALGRQLGIPEKQATDLGEKALMEMYKTKYKPSKFDPLPQDQIDAIKRITNNPDWNKLPSEEKLARLAAEGVNPDTAGEIVTSGIEQSKEDYRRASDIHKGNEKTIEEIRKTAELAKKVMPTIEVTIPTNEQWTDPEKFWDSIKDSYANIPLLSLIPKSERGQKMDQAAPIIMSVIGGKMSGVLTNSRQKLIEKKLAGPTKSKETNRMLLYLSMYDQKLDILKDKALQRVISNSPYKLSPSDLNEKIDEQMYAYRKMIDDDLGDLLDGKIPKSPMSHNNVTDSNRLYKFKLPSGKIIELNEKRAQEAIDDGLPFVR